MAWDYVSIDRQGPIALVTFDRKENKNAVNQQLILEMTEAAQTFQDDLQIQAIIVTGAPEAFSAGADLKDPAMWDDTDKSDLERRVRFYRGVKLCQTWESLPQITIAAIEGLAVGAGVALALALDWRVMASDAYLYVPEVKIGLNLQWGALPRLITLVGPARAKRITLMCERMPAATAKEWGLVEEISDPGKAVDVARSMADATVQMPAVTLRMVKEAVNAGAGALHRATSFADADQSQLCSSFAPTVEARAAFRDRK